LSAGIGVLERGRVLIVDRVEGSGFVRDAVQVAGDLPVRWGAQARKYRLRADRDIGRELPAHSTALGKVLLAFRPRQEVLAIVARYGLARFTRKTIISRARLFRELALVREQGYAAADEEHHGGLRSIAAPIFGAAGEVSAAVALNGGLAEPAWAAADVLVQKIKAAGREISRRARF
jgi:DNA-binding IclR family transcriptional regulator